MNQVDYYRNVYYDLLKAFWDERGRGSRYRTLEVGVSQFDLHGEGGAAEWTRALRDCAAALESHGLMKRLGIEREGNVLRLSIERCIHEGEDRRVKETPGMEIFCCPIGNVLMAAMDRALGISSEMAEVEMRDGGCRITLVAVGADLDSGTRT